MGWLWRLHRSKDSLVPGARARCTRMPVLTARVTPAEGQVSLYPTVPRPVSSSRSLLERRPRVPAHREDVTDSTAGYKILGALPFSMRTSNPGPSAC